MKLTLSWLGQYLSLDGLSATQIADRLTMLGLEVESTRMLYGGLEAIKTAKVLSVSKHPNADRLTLCAVEVGDQTLSIVCGAPNVRPGLITAIALPGTCLPGGMEIQKTKVRGQISEGMLCSFKELEISEASSGLAELDPALASGQSLVEALGLQDTLLEVDLTPNRADCASVLGIAREVAGFSGQSVQRPVQQIPHLPETGAFTVRIDAPELCPRYAARRLSGVTVQPSPWWLQRQLLAVGMRPINNIVDITNFVMLEYGQPLHAFDFSTLAGQALVVRRPQEGEQYCTTLDGNQRSLEPEMLLICDVEKPVALAGVMGGLNSEVTEKTTEILLEAACFDPVSIRRTARRCNLTSEASYRFERGVNPEGVTEALERAVQLICHLTGARAEEGLDLYPGKKEPLQLRLRVQRVNSLLGTKLTRAEMATFLQAIDFTVVEEEDEVLQVTVPPFRMDIAREIDLIEEVARLVGYNAIPVSSPLIHMDCPQPDSLRRFRQKIAQVMTGLGFYEAINYSFVTKKHSDMMDLQADDPRRHSLALLNPLSEEQGLLRTMLLPGLLENIRRNINFQQHNLRLFEMGKVFHPTGQDNEQPVERHQLCAVISGGRHPESPPLYFSGQETDIFDLKGVAQMLLQHLNLQGKSEPLDFHIEAEPVQPYANKEGTVRIMDGAKQLALIGQLSPKVARAFSLKQEVYFMEWDMEHLLHFSERPKTFQPLPRYPATKRDIALLVPQETLAGDLLKHILDLKLQHVVYADIFDVYLGKAIEDTMKSVALTVTYRSNEGTLDDARVDSLHEQIVNSLMSRFGGRYREGKQVYERTA
jgi:phenylalanyl-tRNA synthetase beta chain